jgi:hypothetical protein
MGAGTVTIPGRPGARIAASITGEDAMNPSETSPTAEPQTTTPSPRRRDDDAWAKPVDRLAVPDGALGVAGTVAGRRVAGPLQGFGQMWQKTFRASLPPEAGVTPQEVVATWKAEFPTFWPMGNTFYAPLAGIRPGEVALFSISTGGPVKLHTGVLVLFADDDAFTLMTPEGHVLAAWITFGASRSPDGGVTIEAHALERASDPLFEIGYMLGANRANNRFWEATVRNVAARFGTPDAVVDTEIVCVDKRRQWRYARNVRYNAGFRSALHAAAAPLRMLREGRLRR